MCSCAPCASTAEPHSSSCSHALHLPFACYLLACLASSLSLIAMFISFDRERGPRPCCEWSFRGRQTVFYLFTVHGWLWPSRNSGACLTNREAFFRQRATGSAVRSARSRHVRDNLVPFLPTPIFCAHSRESEMMPCIHTHAKTAPSDARLVYTLNRHNNN